jgi:type I restriction enzyme S subunit
VTSEREQVEGAQQEEVQPEPMSLAMASDVIFPSDWQHCSLEDAMDAIIDYRGKSPTKTSSGIPLITARVVKDGRILTPDEFIAPEEYEEWMRR